MKKFFLLLLIFVLPLQISWAATTVYCNHEQGGGIQHIGHHQHVHEKKSPGKALQAHDDCGYCHAAAQVSIPNEAILFDTPAISTHTGVLIFSYSSYIPEVPRPPNRNFLA